MSLGSSSARFAGRRVMAADDRAGGRPNSVVEDREAMIETLERERERVARTGAACCVAVVSVDRLDPAAADLVSRDLGERLLNGVRPYDSVFRYGADKFLIALPHTKAQDVPDILGRLRDVVSDEPTPMPNGRELAVTASLGAAIMDGQVSLRAVLDRADQALRTAVSAGGDSFHLWTSKDRGV